MTIVPLQKVFSFQQQNSLKIDFYNKLIFFFPATSLTDLSDIRIFVKECMHMFGGDF